MYFFACPDLKQRLLSGRLLRALCWQGILEDMLLSYQSLSWGDRGGEGGAEYHGHPGPRTRVAMAVQPARCKEGVQIRLRSREFCIRNVLPREVKMVCGFFPFTLASQCNLYIKSRVLLLTIMFFFSVIHVTGNNTPCPSAVLLEAPWISLCTEHYIVWEPSLQNFP